MVNLISIDGNSIMQIIYAMCNADKRDEILQTQATRLTVGQMEKFYEIATNIEGRNKNGF